MFDISIERKRAELYKNIRSFFDEKGYLEVFTPTLSDSLIPEPTIKNFESTFINEFTGNKNFYLIPSPEIFIKRLIASGSGSVYEISKCFRNSEQLGSIHNPEFTMLEYYTMDYDEADSIGLTIEMLRKTAIIGSDEIIFKDPLIMSVDEAVFKYAGFDLSMCHSIEKIREEAERKGHLIPEDESWDDTFNRIFIDSVEPNLPPDVPVILKDYPAEIECLAKKNSEYTRARWEMYIKGIEVANCYKEETDKKITRSYYEKEYEKLKKERKKTGDVIPDADFSFCDIDMKESSGVAMGLDRLLMIECGKKDIEDVLSFSFKGMLDGKV